MSFEPKDPFFEQKVRNSFGLQTVMKLIGAELFSVAPGKVVIRLPYRKDLCQQNGFIHAGIITTIADSACGYSSFSLMPPETGVLSVEFKLNLLTPALGDFFMAEGQVIRPGKTLFVARSDVFSVQFNQKKMVATMQATIMCLDQN
ncbi:MAG: PaaI family thioesterase [Pyrinomonadaceae bacterium]